MKHYQSSAKNSWLLVTSLFASSLFAIAPTQAATFSFSEATFTIDNFNRNPLDVRTIADTVTNAISQGGIVGADADAEASFVTNPNSALTVADNYSYSTASGEGNNYLGFGRSIAGVIGYDFEVQPGETLSFDFNGLLDLSTSIDNPPAENAKASGDLAFELIDTRNGNVLDFFTIAGNIETEGLNDKLTSDYSQSVRLNPSESSFTSSFGGNQEFARADVKGTYSRKFDNLTYVTLVEAKRNQAIVKAPEPSVGIALLVSAGLFGLANKRRRLAKVN